MQDRVRGIEGILKRQLRSLMLIGLGRAGDNSRTDEILRETASLIDDVLEIDTQKAVDELKSKFNGVAYELNNGDPGNDELTLAKSITKSCIKIAGREK